VGGARFAGRRAALAGDALQAESGTLRLVPPDGHLAGAVLRLDAPPDEDALPPVVAQLHQGVDAGAAAVAVEGGTPLTRSLLAEEARLVRGVPAVVVADLDDDVATTLLLSGRADLVAAPPATSR
jgi:hypothetical protein